MRRITYVILFVLSACTNPRVNEKHETPPAASDTAQAVSPTPPDRTRTDTTSTVIPESHSAQSDFTVKVYKNDDGSGYGYDLLSKGRLYIHQPTIPAVQGNRGFQSEEQAGRVASLAIYKLRHNIVPPTIDVRELDSMGVK